ncbi:MAG: hypothetical protein AAFQ80_13405 [Cyanobacteria bacterium J06621_8]
MSQKFSNQQSDWLDYIEELDDVEASQVIGGNSIREFALESGQRLDQMAQNQMAQSVEPSTQPHVSSQQLSFFSNVANTYINAYGRASSPSRKQ